MKKRTKALCLLLALLLRCGAAGAETAVSQKEKIFTPNVIIPEINAYRQILIEHIGDEQGFSADKVQELQGQFALNPTDKMENMIYFGNADWSVEAGFYYADGGADADKPATTFSLVVSDKIDSTYRNVLAVSLLLAVSEHYPELDVSAAAKWLDEGKFEGEMFPLFDGYNLTLLKVENTYQISILKTLE